MQVVSDRTDNLEFASRGVAIFQAISSTSPVPLDEFESLLDFGCGCGGLSRLLKGFKGKLSGCDVDKNSVDWVNNNLDYMSAKHTKPNQPLPYENAEFECIVGISVFTHLSEKSQDFYLAELSRCLRPDGYVILSIHGNRALHRAKTEESIFRMLAITKEQLRKANFFVKINKHAFALQPGHLTSETYDYGIAFTSEKYVRKHWAKYFEIINISEGAIHDWQSVVIGRKK
jgi:cyclopropane fatty-acyl-phospholipid synthase-like methyltransferase